MITHLDLMLAVAPDVKPLDWLRISCLPGDTHWVFNEKIDGIRVLAADGRLITRNGFDVTEHFPEVSVPSDWHLDCEIAVLDAQGRADFEAVNRRAKGGQGGDAVLFVFDALAHHSQDLRGQSYQFRWLKAFTELEQDETVQVLPLLTDGHRAWQEVAAAGGEGLMARLGSGSYIRGRSKALIKLKRRETIDVVVVGRTPGEGSRAGSFGALQVALVDMSAPAGFRRVGEVGSGFSAADVVDVLDLLAAGRPFVIEVEHLGWTSTGKLRQPVFHRIRSDVDVLSCQAP